MSTVKRAGKGLSPLHWDKVIGSRAKKDYRADQKIFIFKLDEEY